MLEKAHGDYLRALARKLCKGHFDPDDLVQDVFEKTIRAPVPPGANERAWLARVLHNRFIDLVRRRKARPETELAEEPGAAPPSADDAWWLALSVDDVRAAMAQLPEDQRVTFELFAFAGRSYDEIAAQLGIAKNTVGTRVLRARTKLRDLLSKGRA